MFPWIAGFSVDSLPKDSRYLLTASSDGTGRIWSCQNGKCVRVLGGHQVGLGLEDGVDLYLSGLEEWMAWDIFWEKNKQVAVVFPPVVCVVCSFQKKELGICFFKRFEARFEAAVKGLVWRRKYSDGKSAWNIMKPEAFPIWNWENNYLPKPPFVDSILVFRGGGNSQRNPNEHPSFSRARKKFSFDSFVYPPNINMSPPKKRPFQKVSFYLPTISCQENYLRFFFGSIYLFISGGKIGGGGRFLIQLKHFASFQDGLNHPARSLEIEGISLEERPLAHIPTTSGMKRVHVFLWVVTYIGMWVNFDADILAIPSFHQEFPPGKWWDFMVATGRLELLQLLSDGRQSDHRGAGWFCEGLGVRGRHRRCGAGTANWIWAPNKTGVISSQPSGPSQGY